MGASTTDSAIPPNEYPARHGLVPREPGHRGIVGLAAPAGPAHPARIRKIDGIIAGPGSAPSSDTCNPRTRPRTEAPPRRPESTPPPQRRRRAQPLTSTLAGGSAPHRTFELPSYPSGRSTPSLTWCKQQNSHALPRHSRTTAKTTQEHSFLPPRTETATVGLVVRPPGLRGEDRPLRHQLVPLTISSD